MQPSNYIVLWNGVNDGHDGDLLCASSRVWEKTAAVGRPRSVVRPPAWEVVLAALGATREEGQTLLLLAARTGLNKETVNSALCVLRNRERLASEVADPSCRRSHGTRRYWRAADPVTL